jgi:hypothetical protein
VLEVLISGMLRLYLSSPQNVPTGEEAAARLGAFRESGLSGAAALMPDSVRAEAVAYLNELLNQAAKDVQLGRLATIDGLAAAARRGVMQ